MLLCICQPVFVYVSKCLCVFVQMFMCSCPNVYVYLSQCLCVCVQMFMCMCPNVYVYLSKCFCVFKPHPTPPHPQKRPSAWKEVKRPSAAKVGESYRLRRQISPSFVLSWPAFFIAMARPWRTQAFSEQCIVGGLDFSEKSPGTNYMPYIPRTMVRE